MRVITAPEVYIPEPNDIKVFLAGGITGCYNWQSDVIKKLHLYDGLDRLVVFNPRRDNFPIDDPDAAPQQIKWEFTALEQMDIFSMYFDGGESLQPICQYELGRYICRMQMRFPADWEDRIIVNTNRNYKRKLDVKYQTYLISRHIDVCEVTDALAADIISTGITNVYTGLSHIPTLKVI